MERACRLYYISSMPVACGCMHAGSISFHSCKSTLARKSKNSTAVHAARRRAVRRTLPADARASENGSGVQSTAAASRKENALPIWYTITVAVLVAVPPILCVYGHAYGYSPDLHMASIIQVGGAGVLALFFFLQSRNAAIPFWRSPILTPALLFYAWAVLSLLWAHNWYEGAVKLLDWGGALMLALLVSQTLRRESQVRMVLQGILFAGILLLLLGLAQYFFDVDWVDQHAKPAATFNNKNMAAQYILLVFPIAVMLAMYVASLPWKAVFMFFGVVAMFFIFTSDTRGSIIAVSVQILLLVLLALYKLLQSGERRKAIYAVLGVAASIGAVLLALSVIGHADGDNSMLFYLTRRFISLYEALSTFQGETRFQIWLNTIAMLADRPLLGFGVGNWMVDYPLYHMEWRFDYEMSYQVQHINTHQDYLELAAELGLVGMFFLLWMGVQLVRVLFIILNRLQDRSSWLVLGAGIAMIGMAINAIGSFPFEQPVPVMLFMVYGGILDFYYRQLHTQPPLFSLPGHKIGRPAALLCVLLCVGLTVLHYRWYQSEVHFRRATIASHQGNYYLTLLHGKEALRWSKGRRRMANFIAVGHMQRGDVRRAVEAWEQVLEGYPNLMHTLNNISIAYVRLGDYPKALEKADKLIEVRPTPRSFVQKGSVLQTMGRLPEAAEYFRKALEPERQPGLYGKQKSNVLDVLNYLETVIQAAGKTETEMSAEADIQLTPAGPPSPDS